LTLKREVKNSETVPGGPLLSVRDWYNLAISKVSGHRVLLDFSVTSAAVSLTGVVGGLLILTWVTPQEIGLWHSLMIVQAYLIVFQFGAIKGLTRELPFRLGADDPIAQDLAATTRTMTMGGCVILVAGGIGISIFLPAEPEIRFALPAVFFGCAATLYNTYLGVTYRAHRRFRRLTKIQFIQAFANLATLPIVYFLGYPGLPIRFLALQGLVLALNYYWRPMRVSMRFSMTCLWVLFKVGVPIFLCSYLIGVAHTFPRLILLVEGGTAMVGLFAPAIAVLGVLRVMPDSIGRYVAPHMSFQYGKTGDSQSLWPMAWKTALLYLAISVPCAATAFLLLPFLVTFFIPQYATAIPAMQWITAASVFGGASASIAALRSLKAWRWLFSYVGVYVSTAYALPKFLVGFMDDSLKAVAIGLLIAEAFSSLAALAFIFKATHSSRYSQIQFSAPR